MEIKSVVPNNTCCDMRDSWNVISKLSNEFWVIVHWPSWCENEFFYNDETSHSSSFSTKLNEFDVTMWTWYDKLYNKIDYILKNCPDIKILFVLWTCSSELIWDDIDSIVNDFDTWVKIIILHTSWMRWAWYHFTKYNIFKSLFNIFNINTDIDKNNKSINIFFQDWMQNEEFRDEIIEFLSIFWIKVNSFFNSSVTLEEIKTINNVSCNFLIGKDEEFITLLDYLRNNFNIPYKILDLPIATSNINKFFYTIYSTFFNDKNKYIIELLRYQNKIKKSLNFTLLLNNSQNFTFVTNSKLFSNLLWELKIQFNYTLQFNFKKSINFSHKFNFSNKIVITKNSYNISYENLYWNKSFNSINRYMGMVWIYNFYIDIKNQFYYNNFLEKYNKHF